MEVEENKGRNNNMKIEEKEKIATGEITPEMIEGWKKQHGKIFKTVIDGKDYVWRKLRRREYVSIMSDAEEEEDMNTKIYTRQEKIAKIITIYPENAVEIIDNEAGIATSIADEALVRSGFDVSKTEEL